MNRRSARKRSVLAAAAMVLGMFPFLLVPVATAEDATNVTPSSDGWYWDRPRAQANPPEGSPPELGSAIETVGDPFTNAAQQFAGDHLYVGWDPADPADRREMFSGVNFDLGSVGVPTDATITKFTLTVLEHPVDTSPDSQSPRHGTANAEEARGTFNPTTGQGLTRVVVCPFPDFAAGSAGAARVEAPPVQCGQGKVLPSSIATNPYYAAPAKPAFAWTFDITQIMNELHEKSSDGDAFTSIALVADIENRSNEAWITAFHGGGYAEETAANSNQFTPIPGILASISWSGTSIVSDLFGGEGLDAFGEFEEGSLGGDALSGGFGETGLPEDGAATTESQTRAPVAGVFEGRPAAFWDIPIAGWIAAILGAMGIGFAGWILTGATVEVSRPAGAVSALMGGKSLE